MAARAAACYIPHLDDGKTIAITLDAATAEALEASVAAGAHASVEEAASHAIDEWWVEQAMDEIGIDRLRHVVREGANSGPAVMRKRSRGFAPNTRQ